ncbi:MAG: tRNA (adenosine(37)-N6)-dimethylallyltransferase MiaA [Thermodesulfobacteriota bacterium]|nr:MAG: tRNA (adenosine(37)-N6)-dimethylallyltransferase MiaA [Thermodesulfobacteriota bacterium]
MGEKIKLVVIAGPTASGKSALAVELSTLLNGEIINADSMQVYRFMDIGTAKPDKRQRGGIPHHLIDAVDPDEDFTAARFREEADLKIKEIHSRGKNPFVVGGTGLYIKTLTKGIFEGPGKDKALRAELLRDAGKNGGESLYARLKEVDPVSAASIHPNNLRRIIRALEVYALSKRPISEFQREHAFTETPYDTLTIGLKKERDRLYADIDKRVEMMIKNGLVEETKKLIEMGYSANIKPLGGLGYKEAVAYLAGEISIEEAVMLIKRNTRHYAKRQMTWFRKYPEIKWFNPEEKTDIIGAIRRHFG